MTSDHTETRTLAEAIDRELRECGSAERAQREKSYLKSELVHYGVSVPDTRSIVRAALRGAGLSHDEVVELATTLWSEPPNAPVHERRTAATMVLIQSRDRLGAGDAEVVEALLRQARTWALVDPLACDLVGPLSDTGPGFGPVLERWAVDEDFWIRRAALLAHLVPLRRGHGDFQRFARFAEAMLEEKEFFIRKAIGWVLRDTSKKRSELVYDWLLPRAHRASGVTIREAIKHLSEAQRQAVLAAR
ncbi:DNA alkylation repair protein [Brevibacterium sp. GP-SGM9]|uniref:DNA alkylation repair protein n=1 Tax=Brevibacterium sp. GP-SGM9 TaxID=3376990 RepID=UPI0039A4BF11